MRQIELGLQRLSKLHSLYILSDSRRRFEGNISDLLDSESGGPSPAPKTGGTDSLVPLKLRLWFCITAGFSNI